MDAPMLEADEEDGTGFVVWPAGWHQHSAILRADILKDWLFDLGCEYEVAVAELCKPAKLQS